MVRTVISILVGFFSCAILSTVTDHVFHMMQVYPPYGEPMFDTGLLILAFAYRAVYTLLGGYWTAMIAKEKAKTALWILGTVGSLLWLAGAIVMWAYAAPWYNILGIVTGIPLVLMGGKLYERRAAKAVV